MREILFRGKTTRTKMWVFGHYSTNYGTGRPEIREKAECCFTEVIPETVGQYTGLLDKDGKKVFEGDIVEAYNLLGESEGIGVVQWSDTFAGWHISKTKGMYCADIMSYKIIGNVFDTPELLEVSNDEL